MKGKLINKNIDNLKVRYKKDKKKFLLLLSSLFLVLSLICGTSYAYLTYVDKTDNTTLIEAGTLALTLKNESNEIILDGAAPQKDDIALEKNKEYEFSIENKGSLDSIYKIKLNNICSLDGTFNINGEEVTPDKCVPNEYIKVGLKKTDNTLKEGILKGTPDINGATLSSIGMEFDGDDYIDMGNASFDFGSSITVAARFKLTKLTGTIQYLIGNPEDGGFLLYVDANNNIRTGIYSSADSAYKYATTNSPKIELNKWYTVVGIYDGVNVQTYINGVKEVETPLANAQVLSVMPIFIGANPGASGQHSAYLNGTISDALVINDVLSEEEIAKNYNGQINYYDNDKTLFYQNWNEKVYSDYEVLEYDEEDDTYILDQDVLKPNEERSYKMKLWLDYDTPNDYNAQNMYNIIYSGALAIDYEQTKYKEVDVSYKVSFDANGGTGEMTSQTFNAGDKKALSKNTFTKEGATFVGWSTSTNGTVKYSDEEVVSKLANIENKIVKLYAVWAINPQTINVSVTTNDTLEIERLVEYGRNADIILDVTGYNNPSVTCTNGISAGVRNNILKVTNVTSDTTCEVEYTPNTYKIEYDLNGGEAGSSLPEEATYDENITISNPSKIGYGFAGWTSDDINTKTAYYGDTSWTDGSVKVTSETFKNLTSDNNGKVTLKANWDNNVYTVKYDANTGTGTTMEESYHAYGVSSSLSKNTYTKVGYNFIGWSKNENAETATYQDGASILNIVDEGETEVTLYAVWKLKEKNITINMTYDTSTFSGPSSAYSTDEYQTISKSSTKLAFGTNETITASPAYPDDRYTGSVSCTNGITASLTAGSGTTTRTDSVVLTNNSDTNTDSVCTITYTPKWQGIAYGTYSANGTTTYAGKTWTVKADNGGNTGLALNGIAGTGAYKADVQSNLANSAVNTDVTGGGIVPQSTGAYVSTDSGIYTGLTTYSYWTGDGKFYNHTNRSKYSTTSHGYKTGSNNGRSESDTWLPVYALADTLNTSTAMTTGIISKNGTGYSESGGKIIITNGGYGSAAQTKYYSRRYMHVDLVDYDEVDYPATSSRLMSHVYRFRIENDGSVTVISDVQFGNTYRITVYTCGGSSHGKRVVYRYKSSTAFYYGNEATGTGWPGTSFTTDDAESYVYDGTNGWYWGQYAGGATTTCSNNCASSGDCSGCTYYNSTIKYHRTYRNDTNSYCIKPTTYTVKNGSFDLYYRPYVIVRER